MHRYLRTKRTAHTSSAHRRWQGTPKGSPSLHILLPHLVSCVHSFSHSCSVVSFFWAMGAELRMLSLPETSLLFLWLPLILLPTPGSGRQQPLLWKSLRAPQGSQDTHPHSVLPSPTLDWHCLNSLTHFRKWWPRDPWRQRLGRSCLESASSLVCQKCPVVIHWAEWRWKNE